jgi:hypothetical protein
MAIGIMFSISGSARRNSWRGWLALAANSAILSAVIISNQAKENRENGESGNIQNSSATNGG